MKIKDITQYLESFAPLSLQESYDNSGLIVGSGSTEVTGALICLDSTEEVVDEAIANNCNLIIAHHPIVFSGLKRFNGKNYIERTVMKAIKNDIAIYAIHTNLDNVYNGVNGMIAERIGLTNTRILSNKKNIDFKLISYVPQTHTEEVLNALFDAGAGNIGNYSECSFSSEGKGTFKGNENSNAFVGEKGNRHTEPEHKIEVLVPGHLKGRITAALKKAHPYEEVAFDLFTLQQNSPVVGSGMVGELEEPMPKMEFLKKLKTQLKTDCIRFTDTSSETIKKVAICGGAGSFLLGAAKGAGADIFITGDFKYHQFFDGEDDIMIADVGHYESEQYTKDLINRILSEKFSTFAPLISKVNTNPINYL